MGLPCGLESALQLTVPTVSRRYKPADRIAHWNQYGYKRPGCSSIAFGSQVACDVPEVIDMMQSGAFKNPERVHLSLLAAGEKRFLIWLAERMPSWIHSDHLTAIGFLGMILAGASYWVSSVTDIGLFLATFFLGWNWFGDSLDGTLARVRNRQRPRYGFYVDHVIDAFGVLFLLGGMALSGYMSKWVASGLLIVYYLLSIEIALATIAFGTFKLSFGRVGPTELRIALAIGNIVLLVRPVVKLFGEPYKLFDVGGVIAILGLLVVVLLSAVRNTIRLYKEEKL